MSLAIFYSCITVPDTIALYICRLSMLYRYLNSLSKVLTKGMWWLEDAVGHIKH